jgi:hypothetical protein
MMSLILKDLDKYMFSSKHMTNYNKIHYTNTNKTIQVPVVTVPVPVPAVSTVPAAPVPVSTAFVPVPAASTAPVPVSTAPVPAAPTVSTALVPAPVPAVPVPAVPAAPVPAAPAQVKDNTSFTPFQKDKLFWCFYVLLNGFTDYEMHHTGHYALEKAFKISSVEKLRGMKSQIKELKLKITEVEDELVNKEQISIKGLHVLCLVHKVSITYIYGKQYCEFLYGDTIKGIVQRNDKKEHALLYEDTVLETIKNTHWFIENVQKPLKAPTAYTVKELQDICEKLEIPLTFKQKTTLGQIVEKNKLKKELYEDILTKL